MANEQTPPRCTVMTTEEVVECLRKPRWFEFVRVLRHANGGYEVTVSRTPPEAETKA
jgi:hypothetical protein